jgi:hypothetical protein
MISQNSVQSLAFSIATLDQSFRDAPNTYEMKTTDMFLTENIGLNDGENFDRQFLVDIY